MKVEYNVTLPRARAQKEKCEEVLTIEEFVTASAKTSGLTNMCLTYDSIRECERAMSRIKGYKKNHGVFSDLRIFRLGEKIYVVCDSSVTKSNSSVTSKTGKKV